MYPLTNYQESVDFIRERCADVCETGIILGTGLGDLVHKVETECSFDYSEIPHFPVSTVETHKGKLVIGRLEGKRVVVMQGRFHYYEGYSMEQVTYPVRVMKLLGVKTLLVSNIAGGINPAYELGDLMVIEDHINLLPENPLRGRNNDNWGPRWPDMFEPYDRKMIDRAIAFGKEKGYRIHEGVYASVPGPNLETRAEYRFLDRIGADAVGMSTVPEILVAVHMGIRCFAVSIISDLCYPPKLKRADIEELLAAAASAQPATIAIFCHLIQNSK